MTFLPFALTLVLGPNSLRRIGGMDLLGILKKGAAEPGLYKCTGRTAKLLAIARPQTPARTKNAYLLGIFR